MKTITRAAAIAAMILSLPAAAAPIFSSNFNDYSAPIIGLQPGTGLTLGAAGTVADWNAAGFNALHAVDRSGSGDWAIMLYAGHGDPNTITSKAAIAANAPGVTYEVDFQSAAAAWSADMEGTTSTDFIRFELLRFDGSVLTSFDFSPATWTVGATNPFAAGSFDYAGDGSGSVNLRISGVSSGDRFGGAVDNVSISTATSAAVTAAVPEPGSWAMMIAGFGALGSAMRSQRRSRCSAFA